MRTSTHTVPVLTAKAATGVGTPFPVANYRHITLLFSSDTSWDLTCKFAGSSADAVPAFETARTTSNHWDYIAVNDLQDAAKINGDTGIVLTGTDDFRTLVVNTDGLNWFNAEVTARAAGSATVKVVGYE